MPSIDPKDPVWLALLAAPIDDTPETEEERRDIEETKRTNVWVSSEAITAMIAERRAREETQQGSKNRFRPAFSRSVHGARQAKAVSRLSWRIPTSCNGEGMASMGPALTLRRAPEGPRHGRVESYAPVRRAVNRRHTAPCSMPNPLRNSGGWSTLQPRTPRTGHQCAPPRAVALREAGGGQRRRHT